MSDNIGHHFHLVQIHTTALVPASDFGAAVRTHVRDFLDALEDDLGTLATLSAPVEDPKRRTP